MDEPPSDTVVPEQIVELDAIVADGTGLTVTFTLSVLLQPVAVIFSVSLYNVVTVGNTAGILLVLVNPLGLLVQL